MGLVVRKIKEQHIFSYYWVNDSVGRILAESVQEKESLHLDTNTLPSFVNLEGKVDTTKDESLTLPSDLNSGKIIHNICTIIIANYNYYIAVLPSIDLKGGSTSTSVSGSKTGTSRPQSQSVRSKDTNNTKKPNDKQLTRSEEQFFDVVRMRMTEVQVASKRVENFARHMWNSKEVRASPLVKTLVNVNIIAPLSKWYFNAINRRLVRASPTEPKGMAMFTDARRSWIKADNLVRRAQTLLLITQHLEQTPQPWQKLSMLGPKERGEKERWKANIKARYNEIEDVKKEAEEWREEGYVLKRASKNLMSRMELSDYVFNNIKIKILASRHKESLLERMDMETIKVALIGDSAHEALSSTDMDVIRTSIQKEKPLVSTSLSLDEMVDLETIRQGYSFTRMFSKKALLDDDYKQPSKFKTPAINPAHAKQTMPKKYKNYLTEFSKLSLGTKGGGININYTTNDNNSRLTPMSPSLISLVNDDDITIASIASNNSLNLGSLEGSIKKQKQTNIKKDKKR